MLIVLLQFKHGRGLEEIADKLAKVLPGVVSLAFDVPNDIEVRVSESHKSSVNARDLEMTIIADDFHPEHTAIIEARSIEILKGVRRFLADYDRNLSGWVWILPQQNTAFEII